MKHCYSLVLNNNHIDWIIIFIGLVVYSSYHLFIMITNNTHLTPYRIQDTIIRALALSILVIQSQNRLNSESNLFCGSMLNANTVLVHTDIN